jgi:uncharacterized protein YjbJ (UPF0337 family)
VGGGGGHERERIGEKEREMQNGKTDDIKGRVKEAAGSLLDDDQLKREGRAEQLAGKVKKKVGEAVDTLKEVLVPKEKEEQEQKKSR